MEIENINSRDDLPKFFTEMGYTVGAEIGVYKAEFTEKLCKEGLKIYGIDPYIVYKNYRKHPKEMDYEVMYQDAKKIIESYNGTLMKKTSMDALEYIPDESLDFVYIDGNHSLPYAVADIYEWNRKVKIGGCISGHDYFLNNHNPYWIRICHVKYAVDILEKIFEVKKYIIGEGRDKYPSWMWIKK